MNPHINEHAPDLAWTKQYGERVKNDTEDFKKTIRRKSCTTASSW
ncbi:hypothetical protein ACFTAO_32315 [Paenibacillus rhizoplanae]